MFCSYDLFKKIFGTWIINCLYIESWPAEFSCNDKCSGILQCILQGKFHFFKA